MLKKWTALVLTAVMALTVFVGCEAPTPQEDAVKTYLEAVRDGNTELMRVADGYTTRDIDFGFARQVIEKKRKKAKIKILSSTEPASLFLICSTPIRKRWPVSWMQRASSPVMV